MPKKLATLVPLNPQPKMTGYSVAYAWPRDATSIDLVFDGEYELGETFAWLSDPIDRRIALRQPPASAVTAIYEAV